MKKIFLFLSFLTLILTGCSQIYQITPTQAFQLDGGRFSFLSNKEYSSVKLELAKLTYRDNLPLLLLVQAKINPHDKSSAPIFSIDSFNLLNNPMGFIIVSAKDILNSSIGFTNALQDFSIPTPPLDNNTQFGFFFSPFFGFYPTASFNNSYYRESEFSRRILFSHYLKPTTLGTDFKGGFIALSPKDMKNGMIDIEIKINKEIHIFTFNFKKLTDQ